MTNCAHCGKELPDMSAEEELEAIAEHYENFPGLPFRKADVEVVCDECYTLLTTIYPPQQ